MTYRKVLEACMQASSRGLNLRLASFIIVPSFLKEEILTSRHSLAKHAFGLGIGHRIWLLNPPDLNCIHMNIIE